GQAARIRVGQLGRSAGWLRSRQRETQVTVFRAVGSHPCSGGSELYMRNLKDTLVVTIGLAMGIAVGVLTTALGLALVGSPWELHFAAKHVAAVAVALTGITVVAQGVVIVVDLLPGASL